MSTLTLPSVNGGPRVEYRDLDGQPVPYMVTIQRRTIQPDGREFRDGSPWETITVGDVIDQLRVDGPVAQWLYHGTRVACDPLAIAQYAQPSDPAYLRNINW